MNHIYNTGHIHCGAKGALIHTRAAGHTLFIIDLRFSFFRHTDGVKFTGPLAGAFKVGNGGIWANCRAPSAFHAFTLVNMRHLFIIKINRSRLTCVRAPMGNTSPTEIRNRMPCFRTFITGDINNLNDIRIIFISTQRDFNPFCYNRSVLINTTAHGRLAFFHNFIGDLIEHRKGIIPQPSLISHFHQNFVLQFLHICIKNSHTNHPLLSTIP